MRLNIGAGNKRIEGYTGVDAVARSAADIVAPADSIPLPDASVDEIMAIHLFEHLYRWECDGVLREWRRLLKVGGLLVLEMPDLLKTCKNVVDGVRGGKHPDQLTMWSLYGDPRDKDQHMTHRWAWHPASLSELLAEHGFSEMKEKPTQFHRAGKEYRDFRMEARKA